MDKPTGNGADLRMVFYGKEGKGAVEWSAFNDVSDEKRTDKDHRPRGTHFTGKYAGAQGNRLHARITKDVKERKPERNI